MADVNGRSLDSCRYEIGVFDRMGATNCVWAVGRIEELEQDDKDNEKAIKKLEGQLDEAVGHAHKLEDRIKWLEQFARDCGGCPDCGEELDLCFCDELEEDDE